MIACTSPPQHRRHRMNARPDNNSHNTTMQGVSFPRTAASDQQPVYIGGGAAAAALNQRREGVRAEVVPAPPAAHHLVTRFRNDRDDERDDALVISEVHGVVRAASVVRHHHQHERDQRKALGVAAATGAASAEHTHHPAAAASWRRSNSNTAWNESNIRAAQAVPRPLGAVPNVQLVPRGEQQPRPRYHPPQAWTYQHRGAMHASIQGYPQPPSAPPHWRGATPVETTSAPTRRLFEQPQQHPSLTAAPKRPWPLAQVAIPANTTSSNIPEQPRPSVATPPPSAVARLMEGAKRSLSVDAAGPPNEQHKKKPKGLDKLDLLCSATLEIGPLHDNPMGCSCPKSKCIALYCDCFKAGRRCDPGTCSCLDCKNTVGESGPTGARTLAIRNIIHRNPRAFTTAGLGNPLHKLPPGEVACNCIRSRCLKLYCSCFQAGRPCNKELCTCVSCLNSKEDPDGQRQQAIQLCLEKRPDAFQARVREKGNGCACKNNRCIRKYCECFRNNQVCTSKCSCRLCANQSSDGADHQESQVKASVEL